LWGHEGEVYRNGLEVSFEVRNIKLGQLSVYFLLNPTSLLATVSIHISFSFGLNRIAPVLENKEREEVLDREVDDLSASDDEVGKICPN